MSDPKQPHPSPQDAYSAQREGIDAARPEVGRKRRRKPKHEELVDNARASLLSRKTTVVREAEEALTIWKAVRLYGGAGPGPILPSGCESPAALEGLPVEEQVALMVEETAGFAEWRSGRLGIDVEAFLDEIQSQLPQEFAHPFQGLCGAEREALGAEARARLAGDDGLDRDHGGTDVAGRLREGYGYADRHG